MPDLTRRELLEKAFNDVEEKDDESKKELSSKSKEEKDENEPEKIIADDEKGGKSDKEDLEKLSPETDSKLSADVKEREAAAKLEKGTQPKDSAPNSWKPEIREHWAKVHPEVRTEIIRRELEVKRALSQTDQIRQFAEQFARIVAPHSHIIRAQNSTPLQAVHNLMETAARLYQGSAQQKAEIIAEIIDNYAVDVTALDDVLVKRVGKSGKIEPHAGEAPPPWAAPIFGFMDEIERGRQERAQRLQIEAAEEIVKIEGLPFFEDLREDMADLMEMAGNRGRKLTMQQAYDVAVQARPEISKIVNQRKAANGDDAATLARARKASSTVKGSPAGANVGSKGQPKSRREALEEAWDEQKS